MPSRVRYSLDPQTEPTQPDASYGILDGETVFETDSLFSEHRGASVPVADVRLLPPCWPSKIVCVGRNYRDHAKELGNEIPAEPLIFLKPPSSLIGAGDAIVYPRLSQRVDHEAELGVVIGRRTRHVSPEQAWDSVYGYTCVNDVTARDLQKKDGQWTRGKGFDTFCAAGPWIVPRSQVDFSALRVRARVDGDVRQDAPVADLIFPINVIIAYVAQFMTLEPGDLIATGTPSGVGPLQPGCIVEVDVAGVGVLRNPVVRGY